MTARLSVAALLQRHAEWSLDQADPTTVRDLPTGRGEAMHVAEVRSLGSLLDELSPETTWTARTSWRVGHHAGRLFALREARHDSTCTTCPFRRSCEYEGDPYNTHGDCLASK